MAKQSTKAVFRTLLIKWPNLGGQKWPKKAKKGQKIRNFLFRSTFIFEIDMKADLLYNWRKNENKRVSIIIGERKKR